MTARFRDRLAATAQEQGWEIWNTGAPGRGKTWDKYIKGVDKVYVYFTPRGGLESAQLRIGQIGYDRQEAAWSAETDRERRLLASEVESWLRTHGHWN
jgi:hypothetical protein